VTGGTAAARIVGPHTHPLNSIKALDGSRITTNAVRAFSSVIVVVDLSRTEGLQLGQVTDYAAIVGLAEIRLRADLGTAPTLLRLFSTSGGDHPTGLTAWDTSLLTALYHTDQTLVLQNVQMATSMIDQISHSTGGQPTEDSHR
jgi:hypothetical protein